MDVEKNTDSFCQSILDGVATPVIQITPDRIIQMINESALQVLGLTREQAVGRRCHELFRTDDCESGECATLRAMKEKRKIDSETVAHIRGRDIPIHYYASPLFNDSGDVIGAVEYFEDLTKLKEKEADLVRAGKEIQGVLNGVATPVIAIDLNQKITHINKTGADLFQKNPEDLVGTICHTLFNTDICKGGNCATMRSIRERRVVTEETIAHIGSNDIPILITATPTFDESGTCTGAVEFIIDLTSQKGAIEDILSLTKAAVEGRLDTRADATRHQGDFRKIVEGVNDTLDAVINPLNVAAGYVDRISKGDIPEKITDEYQGDFNAIKNNLNACIDAVNKLVYDANLLSKAAVEGRLDTRADATRHQGEFRKIVEGVNDTLDAVIDPLHEISAVLKRMSINDYSHRIEKKYSGDFASVAADVNEVRERVNHIAESVIRISNGDLSEYQYFKQIGKRSEEDRLVPAFISVYETLLALQKELNRLTEASKEGHLDKRGNPDHFKGAYADVIAGINQMLDEILIPIGEGNRILEQIRGGNLREKVEIICHGDHEKMKNAINGVHLWLSDLIVYVTKLSEGDMTAHVQKASDNDQIHEFLIQLRENIIALVKDADSLSKAALEGQLDTRADATKHRGDFRKIVEGVNDTLDSVIIPVNEALRVSREYANSNFAARVDPALNVSGDWIEFKEALNNIGIQVSAAVELINKQLLDLASNAEEATASIEEVSAGAQQIAKNAGEVSGNSLRGEDGIHQVLKAMEDLNITVAEVSRRAEDVSSTATVANGFAKNGVELAQKTETAMEEIKHSSSEVEQIVKDINLQMDEIGKIVRLISDIANQTNLLALNAAIEAARAGEAGRGFAVVAAEVKSLAQDSRQSAENITDMITTLQTKAKKANEAMGHAGDTVNMGSAALSETLGAFEQIAASIDEITKDATDVASSSEEQAASVEEVTASINEVSSLVKNTAKEAGDAAAATQEASASIEQISKIIANVNQIAEIVAFEMAKFRI
ncbi:methyl-accepting chemotaxis protein [Methanospirillum sp.]|uniref:methyl-accepting chemotaxis protein n=1 Tax=Methanospirillum sp. TaxID=45200 RepID=UPI001BD498CD|nr:methyl-accepting chemotaxis protein [Methanospirillum sp.]